MSEFIEFTKVVSAAPRARGIADTVNHGQGMAGSTPEFVEHVNIVSGRARAEVQDEVLQAANPMRIRIGG